MLGRTNTGGGGSGGLNFQVIGGTTAPSNPKENMIWVNTSTKITSYIFSATQPTGSAGMVWISTGTSSTVEFNALKKNGIQVYPISAKQYIGGAWVDKTAKSYQDGEWVDLVKTIPMTADVWEPAEVYDDSTALSGKFSDGVYTVTMNSKKQSGSIATKEKITIEANEKTIAVHVVISKDMGENGDFRIFLSEDKMWSDQVASKTVTGAYNGDILLDVSSVSGSHYLTLGVAEWGTVSGVACRYSNVRILK